MSSYESQIVDFVIGSSCLTTSSGKPSGLVVGRGTAVPVQAANHPRMDVYIGNGRAQKLNSDHPSTPMDRTVRLLIECRAVGGTSPDLALDPLKVWAEKRLYNDETMGGLAAEILGWQTEQDTRQLDKTYALATIAVDIRYVTARGNPESQT